MRAGAPKTSQIKLLLNDLQQLHGTCLGADAAGDALGGGSVLIGNHDLHGTYLHTLAAVGAELLVDHVHAGLGILGDGTGLADLGAFAALDAGHGLSFAVLARNDADGGLVRVKGLVEGDRAGSDALQTCHAGYVFLDREFLHTRGFSFILDVIDIIILVASKNCNGYFLIFLNFRGVLLKMLVCAVSNPEKWVKYLYLKKSKREDSL